MIISIFSHANGKECYKSIISFGDSISDTGNSLILSPPNNKPPSAFPPYGETYFGRQTGRFCDGRLIIDFFAQKFGLPLVPPYFGGVDDVGNFPKGVNFAVAECNKLLKKSLILMGEIGGNEFNYAFSQNVSNETIRGLVPDIINAISSELIKFGGVTFLVPGNFPIGCLPVYLTNFQTSNNQDYDRSGCLIWLNEFSEYYNGMLKEELNRIQRLHPATNIVYADYYQAALQLYRFPRLFGLTNTLTACCGGGGPYNFNISKFCGRPGSNLCEDPSTYISWDGVHFTEAAYKLISKSLLDGSTTIPRFNNIIQYCA
ncbi:Lipase, GDSL [Corchorus olitorius]|uniref:Lipase, GDSL n=1 Tax=Corchorus olitorius TaxID=93759 RepID=A0A1R3H4T4_9ROSI|nr:Lipase, GDSL [Corchorus olitorius]